MNVILLNGSPKPKGCTYTALTHVAEALNAEGVTTEIISIGNKPIRGCIGCGKCSQNKNFRCVFDDDVTNSITARVVEADGLVIGSPVYYAGINGALKSVLDRMFYSAASKMAFKPAASVASARRAGTTATLEDINKFIQFGRMVQVNAYYWPMVHGNTPEEVERDEEGLAIMKTLGQNMAWVLKSIEAGRAAGVELPNNTPKPNTNFIR